MRRQNEKYNSIKSEILEKKKEIGPGLSVPVPSLLFRKKNWDNMWVFKQYAN
jgi:hypothetical protein